MYYTLEQLRGPYLRPKPLTDYVIPYYMASIDSLSNPTHFQQVPHLRGRQHIYPPNIVHESTGQTLLSLPSLRFYYKKNY